LKSKMKFFLAFSLSYGQIMEQDILRIKIAVEGCRLGFCGTVSVHTRTDIPASRLRLKCDGTRADTRLRLSANSTSPFKSAGDVSAVDCWQPRCAYQR